MRQEHRGGNVGVSRFSHNSVMTVILSSSQHCKADVVKMMVVHLPTAFERSWNEERVAVETPSFVA